MKLFSTLLLVACGIRTASAARSGGSLSPITRVVDLLKSLTAKIESEGKSEQDLYETFVCWAKSVIDSKTASNAAAESRIGTLKTYVADLAAGRIELTSERVDLEKEIEQLNADIELATDLRNKENSEFMDASDEMKKAIKALESAIDVLKTATKDHKDGVLLGLKTQLDQSSTLAETAALSYAVELGRKFLTKGDAMFLQKILTGDVPTPDWKKLNRAATFKKSYKARSFKIQDVLANLLETFTSNLKEAEDKEAESKGTFSKLMKSKDSEKGSAQDALLKMDKENGAKGLSRSEAETELKELSDQVNNDKKYIDQVSKALATKKTEWKTRSELRAGELEAISKAISILHSDDARDLFKKSLASQSYSFLQQVSTDSRRGDAARALQAAAQSTHSVQLSKLIMRLAARKPWGPAEQAEIDDVIKRIDTMILNLKDEEADDLKQKETCEKDRADDTREAATLSREIDAGTEEINSLNNEIDELTRRIQDRRAQVEAIKAECDEATKIRTEESGEWGRALADDIMAKKLVVEATEVIKSFYSDNNLMLAQRNTDGQPTVVAGEAPPPPPPTWEKPYGGRTEESTGIVAVLGMIAEDISKDMAHAKKNEDDAMKLYIETKIAMQADMDELEDLIGDDEMTRGKKADAVKDAKGDRSMSKGSLDAVMKKIKGAEPGCDFFTINFPLRTKNRQIEVAGLQKAKAILSGASFDPEDPNRELKPGDALLQRARKHQH